MIRPAGKEDIAGMVAVHTASFPGFFTTSLGSGFLALLYGSILDEPGSVSLVATAEDGKVVGFAVGVANQVLFYRRLAARRWLAFGAATFRSAVMHPAVLPRLWRGLWYADEAESAATPFLLVSLAVASPAERKGIGTTLVHEFARRVQKAGADAFCLLTDRDNDGSTNAFYRKMGFRTARTLCTREGRWMNELVMDLVQPGQRDDVNRSTSGCSPHAGEKTRELHSEDDWVLVNWFSRQGYPIVRSESTYWCALGPRVYQAIPFHRTVEPGDDEIRKMLVRHAGIAVRFASSIGGAKGAPSYHVVCDNRDYDIAFLGRQSQQNIHKGLKHCECRRISFETLAGEGWALHHDTLVRQCRRDFMSVSDWRRMCAEAGKLPGFEAWGALVHGELAAAILLVKLGDWIVLLNQNSHSRFLPERVNHALVYSLTKEMMARTEIHAVFYTQQSLDAQPDVDEFKLRMGYTMVPVNQRVVFHPLLAPLVNLHAYRLLQRMHAICPKSPLLGKATGIVRLYLDRQEAKVSHRRPVPVESGVPE